MSKENTESAQTPEQMSETVIEEKMEKKMLDTEPSKSSTVQDLINRVKNDSQITDAAKLNTLALLIMKFRKENDEVGNEIKMVNEQTTKHIKAKLAIQELNDFYKKQIVVIKEDGELRLQDEISQREENMKSYQNTVEELAKVVLLTKANNSSLEVKDDDKADQISDVEKGTDEREEDLEKMKMEYEFQITLLEHQVAKAQIEKAEVNANMAKERLEFTKLLAGERERELNLNETMSLLKHQAELYQGEILELQKGGLVKAKTFQFFKSQIEKLNNQMVELEQQTEEWKENSEINMSQLKEMHDATDDKDKELLAIMKKFETMVKLNKALNVERVELQKKVNKLKS